MMSETHRHLSLEMLKEKVGQVKLRVLEQEGNTRTSCVEHAETGNVLAFSSSTFSPEAATVAPEVLAAVSAGEGIGKVIEASGLPYERTETPFVSADASYNIRFLFNSNNPVHVRGVTYTVLGKPFVTIREVYSSLVPLNTSPVVEQKNSNEHAEHEGIIIAEVKPGDFEEAYLRIAHEFLKKPMHVGVQDPDEFVELTRDTLRVLLGHPGTKLFAAASESGLVGYIATNNTPRLHLNGTEFNIAELYVADDARRGHVGSRLMVRAEEYARSIGAKRISLATNWSDPVQGPFYASLGFVRRCDFLAKKF